jgi:hypothetical protein
MRVSWLGGLGLLLALAGCVRQPAQPPPAAAAPPPPAPPYDIRTFRDLVGVCRTAEADPYYASARGLCWGYVSGVIDFYEVDTATGRRMRRVCLPPTPLSRADAVSGLLTWADANQQYWDENAPNGLMRYYIERYPCGRPMPPPHRRRPPPPPPPPQ